MAPFMSPEGYTPPRSWALLKEFAVAPEIGAAVSRAVTDRAGRITTPYARRVPLRVHEPVLLVPGFLAGDYSLKLLAHALRRNGYRTYRAQIQTNVSCVMTSALELERRIEAIVSRREGKVRIVGHSLGGMLARGLAARRPDLISGVIAMGSPMMAPGTVHPVLTTAASVLVRLNNAGLAGVMTEDCLAGECARQSWDEFHNPLDPNIDFACIYSKRDGLVDWRSCIDPDSRPIQVRASHVGMALSPRVHDLVVEELTRQARAAQLRDLTLGRTAG